MASSGPGLTAPHVPLGGKPADVRARFLVNTLVQFIAPAVRIGLGIVVTAVLSRYLGVGGYGAYALVFAYVATFNGLFNEWGLAMIGLREISRHPEHRAALLGSAATLQGIVAAASYLLLLAGLALSHYPQEVKVGAAIFGLSLLLTPLDLLALPFQAELRLARLVGPAVLVQALTAGLSLAVVWLGGGVVALAMAALVAMLPSYAWTLLLTRRILSGIPRPNSRYWWPLLREAWPLFVSTVFGTVIRQAPVMSLSLASVAAVGLLNAANKIPQQLMLLPYAVVGSAFPLLSQAWVSDRHRFDRLLTRLVGTSLLLSVPAAVAGVGLAGPVVGLLFGPDFGAAVPAFALLMVNFGLLFPGIVTGEALIAAGHQRFNLMVQAVSAGPLLALLAVLVPRYGATGAAIALTATHALTSGAVFFGVWWRLGLTRPLAALGRGLLAALAAGGMLIVLAPLGPVLSAILATLVALAAGMLAAPDAVAEIWRVRWIARRLA